MSGSVSNSGAMHQDGCCAVFVHQSQIILQLQDYTAGSVDAPVTVQDVYIIKTSQSDVCLAPSERLICD